MMIFRSNSRSFALGIFFIFLIAYSQDTRAQDSASGVERMIRQIETLFPVLEGYVLSSAGDRVTIDLKRGQSIAPGQTLKLIRYGKPITHPVTKKIVGHEETDLGQISVLEVRKDYSIAQAITPGMKPIKGDAVRSLFKKVKILMAPVQADDGVTGNPQALGLEIETQLNRHTRFEVPAFDLGVWLLENEVSQSTLTRPENLQSLRQTVAADSILFTRVRAVKGKTVLQYRLASTNDGRVLKEARVLIPALSAVAQSPVKEKKDPAGFAEDKGPLTFVSKHEFDFTMVDFAVGDLTGNGKKDFVIIDDHRVMIYRYENKEFRKVGQLKAKKNINRFLSVDVADINGNGRDEIFVTNHWGDRLKSFVLESVPGKKGLTRIWDEVNRYFRVLRDFDGTPMLVSQRPAFERPFRPGIQQINYKNGKYNVGEDLLPKQSDSLNLTLYGLAFGRIRSGQSRETIFLDNNYKLRVYSSRGQNLASSDEYFGSDPRLIEVGIREAVFWDENTKQEGQPVRFKGRIELVQYDARKFLLVPKNHRKGGTLMDRAVIIKDSSLVFFSASAEGLQKVHESKKLSGYLAGFQVINVERDSGKQVHVATVADRGSFISTKMVSTIYTYNW